MSDVVFMHAIVGLVVGGDCGNKRRRRLENRHLLARRCTRWRGDGVGGVGVGSSGGSGSCLVVGVGIVNVVGGCWAVARGVVGGVVVVVGWGNRASNCLRRSGGSPLCCWG